MSAIVIPFPSPFQPQHDREQERESPSPDSFASRAALVDRLIDAKARFVMESAQLHALAESNTEQSEQYHSLIQTLEGTINRLQEQIDRELKGLLYGLRKSPASSCFLDNLPG